MCQQVYYVLLIVLTLVVGSENIKSKNGDGKGSLGFVFDTTGSMYNDLKQLREGAEMILDAALEGGNAVSNFVFVPFHDPGVGPATVTDNKREFEEALSLVTVQGGGDCPERSLSGIKLALNVSLPGSFVYVFTDATADDVDLVNEVLDLVQRKQSQVVFVLTGHCNDLDKPSYKVYQQIAAASTGQVFNLNKTSVHNVLDFVRSSIQGRMVNLGSLMNPPGYNYTQAIPVDSTLGEVTVSVSGSEPRITVLDPNGEEVVEPKLKKTLDLAEIMVVKVPDPEPGNWSITVGSSDRHTVKVVGVSNLTFSYGFSVKKPSYFGETSYRPLKSTKNYMMISPTHVDDVVTIDHAEIVDLNGSRVFDVPLSKVGDYYLTEPFMPPDEMFYVAINGHDENNQDLRRMGPTAMQAKLPDVPYLDVEEKLSVRLHDRAVLKCHVDSLVPVSAQWTLGTSTRIMMPVTSLQSTSIEYIIEDVRDDHSGKYVCHASNAAGSSQAHMQLLVHVDPPFVNILPQNKTCMVNEEIIIHCGVISDSVLTEFKLTYSGKEKKYEIDIPIDYSAMGYYEFNQTVTVRDNDTGVFECSAKNKAGESKDYTYITINPTPKVRMSAQNIDAVLHSRVILNCSVDNAQTIQWLSPNNSVVKESIVGSDGIVDTLTIDSVDFADNGYWSCVGVNNGYTDSNYTFVNVTSKPQVSISPREYLALYGTTLDLTCTVLSKDAPELIAWHFEDGRIINTSFTRQHEHTYVSILSLSDVKENTQGSYYCTAVNKWGTERDSVYVRVRKPIVLLKGFPSIISANLNGQIELHCITDGYPDHHTRWYHNDTDVFFEDNIHVSLDRQVLFIEKVDLDTVGDYSCVVENDYERFDVNGTVRLNEFERPVLAKELIRKVTQRGKSAVLTCSVLKGKPEPTLTWQYKSPLSVSFAHIPEGIERSGTELVIPRVDLTHAGMYRCVASNVAGTDVYDVALVVQYPPQIKKTDTNGANNDISQAAVGSTVTLSCGAAGEPRPLVAWSKDGGPVVYHGGMYLTYSHDLHIENVKDYDSGVYTCTATSHLGSVRRNLTFLVYGQPVIQHPMKRPVTEVIQGQLVELPCNASGEPAPSVEWRRNGETFNTVDGRKHVGDDFVLRFIANLTDVGQYTCIAQNKYGNTSVTYKLTVWAPPSIEPPLHQMVEVVKNFTTQFQCRVDGIPTPNMWWEYQGKLVENTTRMNTYAKGDMNIINTQRSDEGIYTCVAQSFAGVARKYYHLRVNEIPVILAENVRGPYTVSDMDSELKLPCRVAGKPKPFVTWTRDGSHLDNDSRFVFNMDGSLTLNQPSVELSGRYTCTARNTAGVAERTVDVHVYPHPLALTRADSTTEVNLLEGNDHTLACPVRSDHNTSVTWYHKESLLQSKGELYLKNVTSKAAGSYRCVVNSNLGSYSAYVTVSVDTPPKFLREDNARKVVLKYGEVVMSCEVRSAPKATIKWYFNSKLIRAQHNGILKINNVQTSQSGVYRCVAANKYGDVSREYTLDVFEPPTIEGSGDVEIDFISGTNATLECNARGIPRPKVTWIYNNTDWHPIGTNLHCPNVSNTSQGTFVCVAVNEVGHERLVYHVGVVVPPSVVTLLGYKGNGGADAVVGKLDVKIGTSLRVSCKASGKPSPTIRWIRNGEVLAENKQDNLNTDLTIDAVSIKHSGQYTCVATNEGGYDEKTIYIDILEPPKIATNILHRIPLHTLQHVEIISGQKHFLHCHPTGNPRPRITWIKDRKSLGSVDNTTQLINYGEVLVFTSASGGQSGNYTCVARNSVGEASFTYLVDILVPPPKPKVSSTSVQVIYGNQLNLTCPVEGIAFPTVSWVKQPYEELSQRSSKRVRLIDGNRTLTINKTDLSDSGFYTCRIANRVGASSATFTVVVLKAPSIVHEVNDDVVVGLGDNFVLSCDSDGYPEPEIVWFKDSKKLKLSQSVQTAAQNRVLSVWGVTSHSAGRYACRANNTAGEDYTETWLRVRVPGNWSAWSRWGYCDATCGTGHQLRTRICQYRDEYVTIIKGGNKTSDVIILDETLCTGPAVKERECHMPSCDEVEPPGQWSPWSPWSPCSSTCGSGARSRTRHCSGSHCVGDNVQIAKCPNLPPCDTELEFGINYGDSREDIDSNEFHSPFAPEMTFEHEAGINLDGRPLVHPDVEEFDVATGPDLTSAAQKWYYVNVTSNLDGSDNGPCPYGFRYDDHTQECIDIDECAVSNNVCMWPARCRNVAGRYRCLCPRTYRLHTDMVHCVKAVDYKTPYDQLTRKNYLSTRLHFPPRNTHDRK